MTFVRNKARYTDDTFNFDVFISYTRLDNIPVNPSADDGWVSEFHYHLRRYLAEYTGAEPEIFRDKQMNANIKISPELFEKLRQSALFLAILSPTYFQRKWCRAEAIYFFKKDNCNCLEPNQSRVFKVLKTLVESHMEKPHSFQVLKGFPFFNIDPITGKVTTIKPEFGEPARAEFYKRIAELVQEMIEPLKILRRHRTDLSQVQQGAEELIAQENLRSVSTQKAPQIIRKVIYIAEVHPSLSDRANDMRRHLELQGYTVISGYNRYYTLVSETNIKYIPNVRQEIDKDLRECTLSLHMIDGKSSEVSEKFEQSIIEIQYEAAMEYRKQKTDFPLIVWIPKQLDEQKTFSENKFSQQLQDAPHFLRTSFEELKSFVMEQLTDQKKDKSSIKKTTEFLPKKIYLIYESNDSDDQELEKLYNYLYEHNFEVLSPPFDEVYAEQEHQHSLNYCDGVIIYWGHNPQTWVMTKLDELQDITQLRPDNPISIKIVYITTPQTHQKKFFRTPRVRVARSSAELESYLSHLA